MAEYDVAEELHDYLIDEAVAVAIADADGVNPVIVCDPVDGAPAPANTESGDFRAGTITLTTPAENWPYEDHSRQRTVVSIVVRAPENPQARLIIRSIQAVLTPLDTFGAKSLFQMGQINPVQTCTPFRGAQRVSVDEQGYTYELAYEFLVSRSALSGA